MSPDLRGAIRRIKPEKRRVQFRARRADPRLAADQLPANRIVLIPDTNVYIRNALGDLPEPVSRLLDRSLQFHCSVCLGELAVGVGAYNPAATNWTTVRDYYTALYAAIPNGRVLTPDQEIWTMAGLVAGPLARTQGFAPANRKDCVNDALILLTAAKAGLLVLTANRNDFDLIQQVAGTGTVLHY